MAAINGERSRLDRPKLESNNPLHSMASEWAAKMAKIGKLGHGNFDDRLEAVYPNTTGVENVAMGQTIPQIIQMWLGSLKHRNNMLGNYNLVGVGFAESNNGMTYWCAIFVNKT